MACCVALKAVHDEGSWAYAVPVNPTPPIYRVDVTYRVVGYTPTFYLEREHLTLKRYYRTRARGETNDDGLPVSARCVQSG